jgi:DNA-binding GntR family transcriptional regulator
VGPAVTEERPLALALASNVAQRRTTHEIVVEVLRRAILGGQLRGGTRLVQSEIAAQLGVSTTPVREAIRDLSAEGLLQIDTFRGAIVREATRDEAREIYELRLVLEPIAMRKVVANMSDAELAEAAEIAEHASRETDQGAWVQLNRAFHMKFTQAAHSPRLAGMLLILQDASAIHVSASIQARRQQMLNGDADHRAMVLAVKNKDADEAVRLIREHLKSTLDAIESGGREDIVP